ncbi:MAG TPA: 2-C-methyl-D-erythritol 4-phosphate cytidylyltransferase [Nitrospiria bacterium]|jgi:2-C-methyl-D-erythritol 4-phosphate cytidylyltransferase|nr:2-C-methyl-D-erythritol 4-phosphate cytidylyltransferase [Nitrospiria bacterium]
MTSRVAAVIPAAGSGRRMGRSTPKQFLRLDGIPILVHTLKVFETSPFVHEVCLVVPQGREKQCREELLEPYGLQKVTRTVEGGATRQDSVYRGLTNLSPETVRVVVHDGVRPFLSPALLKKVIKASEKADGAVAAVPLKDTPKYVREDGTVDRTPERARLYLAQTPQVFLKNILIEAYSKAYVDGVNSTDDSALVERLGYRVRAVEGSWENIKITTKDDLDLAEQIIRMRRAQRKRAKR